MSIDIHSTHTIVPNSSTDYAHSVNTEQSTRIHALALSQPRREIWLISLRINVLTACRRVRYKQATIVGLLLATLGNGGRGQMLLTIHRRPSLVNHTQRPVLCTARWVIGRDTARRAGPFESADTC